MAVITVRALNPSNFDPQQGNGQNNFISDRAAVTQIITTRLGLFQGQWFLDLLDGLPMFQNILGSSGASQNLKVIINLISQRIFLSPYVTNVENVQASYQNRKFSFYAEAVTQFGTVYISTGSSAAITASS
jgi:hypothetical protein